MRSGRFGAGAPPGGAGAPGGPTFGFAMLGISCVPGTPPCLMPLSDESGGTLIELAEADCRAPAGLSKESGRVSTLLVASGDTCGPLLGRPTPGVVDASSSGNEGGGP